MKTKTNQNKLKAKLAETVKALPSLSREHLNALCRYLLFVDMPQEASKEQRIEQLTQRLSSMDTELIEITVSICAVVRLTYGSHKPISKADDPIRYAVLDKIIKALPTKTVWYLSTFWEQLGITKCEGEPNKKKWILITVLTRYITTRCDFSLVVDVYKSLELYHGASASAACQLYSPYTP